MDCKMGKSSSSEDYLKCILVLQKKNDLVRSIDIAENIYSKNSLLSRLLELMGGSIATGMLADNGINIQNAVINSRKRMFSTRRRCSK